MENGFVYDSRQRAFVQVIGGVTLIQRAHEQQIAAFESGRCIETFNKRKDAKAFAIAHTN